MFIRLMRAINRILDQMSFRQLTFVALGAGIFMCLLIFFALSRIENNVVQETQVKPVPMIRIVVAKTNIKRGEILQERMLRTKEFTVNSVPSGTSTDIREFVGFPAKVDIFTGDILTTNKVFKDVRQAGFIGMIPENCRAITIPIDDVTGVAGLINPGNYVDLVLVTQDQGATKAEVLLQNIMLLGIDKAVERDVNASISPEENAEVNASNVMNAAANPSNAGGVSGGTATLALLPDEVLKVIAAMRAGSIHLVLRPLNPTNDSMYLKDKAEYIGENHETARVEDRIEDRRIETRFETRRENSTPEIYYAPQRNSEERIQKSDLEKSELPQIGNRESQAEYIEKVESPNKIEVIQWGS